MKLHLNLAVLAAAKAAAQFSDAQWNAAYDKAQSLMVQMTLEELSNLTYGLLLPNGCSGNSGAVKKLSYPGMCFQEGPAGVKSNMVTGFASGVSVAASFNRDLAYSRAFYLGAEAKRKGIQALNAPVVGPIGRIATGGRNWEGFGADAYLSGQLGAASVSGLQKSVIAVVKHFILNEQETGRYSLNGESISSDIDDKTLHELYLTPFQDAVHAGAGAVMCSYNRINGTYGCENNRTLNEILKTELNFKGFVVSDWFFGQRSGAKSANSGLDVAMPNAKYDWADGLLEKLLETNQVPKARVEDMARRILTSWFLVTGPASGASPPGYGLPENYYLAEQLVDARDPESKPSTYQSAVEGHVLVKNVNGALPLQNVSLMSLFGWDAVVPPVNNPAVSLFSKMSFGFNSVNVSDGYVFSTFAGNVPDGSRPDIGDLGTILYGGGSGTNFPSYWIDPYSALVQQAKSDNTYLHWDFQSVKPLVVQSSDACLVMINQFASETLDRLELSDSRSDTLVKTVAASCNNTIVIIHNTWIRLVDEWIDHPNITAVMFAHLPGQDSGAALVDILYGRVSPSGRLPYTVGKNASDYGRLLLPEPITSKDPHTNFSEGVAVDYLHFQSNQIEPRFPFGFGLTYSSIEYADISASWVGNQPPAEGAADPTNMTIGGLSSLFDPVATVTARLSNTGGVPVSEVAQLYLQFPDNERLRHLRGFDKPTISPASSTNVSFALTRRDLSHWDTATQSWQIQNGQYVFFVGADSGDTSLHASLSIP